MKYSLILIFFSTIVCFGQDASKKSLKTSEKIIGTWAIESASITLESSKSKLPGYSQDSLLIDKNGTFIMTSRNKGNVPLQIISGKWKITKENNLILSQIVSDPPFEEPAVDWHRKIKLSKNKLKMYMTTKIRESEFYTPPETDITDNTLLIYKRIRSSNN
ncbi:hypothetical protein [Marinigracilibium pacificum]|uniref:Lipocalin-like protein n=1 Tax=Marinigracilibium pacificum TaxID=2729599 RepID=A0A848J033_9BACT|nr:hypothetical protein [Marinigracilibium pacificum]NMM47619.1 hypothetical protein [Marinigracilibium pacificum]